MKDQRDKNIFFHTGCPKAGSTFLQKHVFPNFNNVRFIKKHDFKHKEEIIRKSVCSTILLSYEVKPDHKRGRERLEEVSRKYPHAYPIIVLRKHESWLKSKYTYYLKKHGTEHFKDYFNFNEPGILHKNHLIFYPKIKLLESLFEQKPLVIFQEELKENPMATIGLLADYMGATFREEDIKIKTVNKSFSSKQLRVVRKFNKIYRYNHSNINSQTIRFGYKKFSGLLIHLVAFISQWVPDHLIQEDHLIPPHIIRKVEEAYREDWEKCLEYAKKQRGLLFS